MKRICKECGKEFELNEGEIQFYNAKKLSLPKRCRECREKKKYAGRPESGGYDRKERGLAGYGSRNIRNSGQAGNDSRNIKNSRQVGSRSFSEYESSGPNSHGRSEQNIYDAKAGSFPKQESSGSNNRGRTEQNRYNAKAGSFPKQESSGPNSRGRTEQNRYNAKTGSSPKQESSAAGSHGGMEQNAQEVPGSSLAAGSNQRENSGRMENDAQDMTQPKKPDIGQAQMQAETDGTVSAKTGKGRRINGIWAAVLIFMVLVSGFFGNQFLGSGDDGSKPTVQNGAGQQETVYHFRSDRYLEEHFKKHGGDFDYATKEAYEEGANKVISSSAAMHKLEAEDGDDVYYLESTNEFVIVSTDGYIRTYFKPENGVDYYNRQ